MLVLLTDTAVILSLNSMFLTIIDRWYISVFLVIFVIPAHVLVDHMLIWLNAPTVNWLRAEFELQQAFASASFFNKRAGVGSKSFGGGKSFQQGSFAGGKSFKQGSFAGGKSFKQGSALPLTSPSVWSSPFTSFNVNGSMKAGANGLISQARHRSVSAVLGVICSVLLVSTLFSSITLWGTIRLPDTDFVELMIRSLITCGAKWIMIDPLMAFTLFPLLAQWEAARLARRVAAYAAEDDGEESGDDEASPGPSPSKQVGMEDQHVSQLETKYERAARDRAMRIAGKGEWEWKRDELGVYKARNATLASSSILLSERTCQLCVHLL
jgi:hypothetical protein